MANIKVRDLTDTTSVTVDNQIMVLTNDTNNLVQNIQIKDLITNTLSSDNNNALSQGSDYKFYVQNPEVITGDLTGLSTQNKSTLVNSINEVNGKIGNLNSLDTTAKANIVDAINEVAAIAEPSLQYDTINQTKALETGNVSNNQTVYYDIVKYSRTTFDTSKFTKTGSPTITNEGIASGFSASNGITLNTIFNPQSNWEILGSFKTPKEAPSTAGCIISTNTTVSSRITLRPDLKIRLFLSRDNQNYFANTDGSLTLEIDTKYYYSLSFNGSKYVLKISTDGENWLTDHEVTNSSSIYTTSSTTLEIGKVGGQYELFTGTIDLKDINVVVDNLEIFNGNKQNIDTIKKDDYLITGTPTITNTGIASGFQNGTNYIVAPIPTLDISRDYSIRGRVTLPNSTPAASEAVFRFGGIQFEFTIRNTFEFSNGSGDKVNSLELDLNSTYDFIVGHNLDNLFYVKWKKASETNYQTQSITLLTRQTLSTPQHIGVGYLNNQQFNGSINLNAFKVYSNGNFIYQPCLKIPYTESITGAKIIQPGDFIFATDMYEQFGVAPYYMLDIVNKTFTLPMGELYGMLNKKANIDLNNTTPAVDFKKQVINWLMPDLEHGISKSNEFTADTSGWLYIYGEVDGGAITVKINGIDVWHVGSTGATLPSVSSGGLILISEGDTVTIEPSISFVVDYNAKFYPVKMA